MQHFPIQQAVSDCEELPVVGFCFERCRWRRRFSPCTMLSPTYFFLKLLYNLYNLYIYMYISRDSVLRGTHIWAKKECNLGHSSKAYTDDGPPRRHRRDLSCTVPNSFWSIHSMPCHAMSCHAMLCRKTATEAGEDERAGRVLFTR